MKIKHGNYTYHVGIDYYKPAVNHGAYHPDNEDPDLHWRIEAIDIEKPGRYAPLSWEELDELVYNELVENGL